MIQQAEGDTTGPDTHVQSHELSCHFTHPKKQLHNKVQLLDRAIDTYTTF